MKKVILILTIACLSFSVQSQILKDVVLDGKPKIVVPTISAKADPLVLDMVSNLADKTFNISMVSLHTYKQANGYSDYSTPLTSKTNKLFNAKKFNALTIEGAVQLSDSKQGSAGIKIFTTSIGGQKMSILYTEKPNDGYVTMSNVKIKKNGQNRYIITGDTNIDGVFTSYIVHIFRNIG